VSDFFELQVKVGDPATHERLRRVLDEQFHGERLAASRRRWMAAASATSVPIGLLVLFPGWLAPPYTRASLALWSTSLLGLGAWVLAEWRSHRRLRALMNAGPFTAD
jgi:hypothetical protein